MSVFKEIATELLKETAIEVGKDNAGKGLKAGKEAAGFISHKVGDIKDGRNKAGLKKQAKKEDYFLLVSAQKELGSGIYKVVSKKKEERYNTLTDHFANGAFVLHLYHKQKGEILSVHKTVTMRQGLFSSKPASSNYEIHRGDQVVGEVFAFWEGPQKVYITDFNDWVVTGNFEKNNYKIFSKTTGKTVATISKKIASADTYVIVCEYDKNEPIIVAITMLLDNIE